MVLVTGATGFIGGHTLRRLLADGQTVRALVRPGSPHGYLAKQGVEVVLGDVTQPETLGPATAGVDTVVHLVGIIEEPLDVTFEQVVAEGTRSLAEAAAAAGVKRMVYVSALGTGPTAESRYHRTKWFAEEALRAAPGEHVILRPSLVVGPGDDFVSKFARLPLPLPGGGVTRFQPIWIDDLVEMIVASLATDSPALVNQTIEVGGPYALSLREICDSLEAQRGRSPLGARLRHPPIPLWFAWMQAVIFDVLLKRPLAKIGVLPPITRDQVLMMVEDNVCDTAPMGRVFGLHPLPFDEQLRRLYPRPA